MTKEQCEWAAKHDWFIRVEPGFAHGEYGVMVRDSETGQRYFSDIRCLREWAGY